MELITCKKCGRNKHNPKYQQCYECSGTKAVAMTRGCPEHLTDPKPSVCTGCMKAKAEFFKQNKAYTK